MTDQQRRIFRYYPAVSGDPDAVKADAEMHAEPALSLADKEQKPETETEQLRSEICEELALPGAQREPAAQGRAGVRAMRRMSTSSSAEANSSSVECTC